MKRTCRDGTIDFDAMNGFAPDGKEPFCQVMASGYDPAGAEPNTFVQTDDMGQVRYRDLAFKMMMDLSIRTGNGAARYLYHEYMRSERQDGFVPGLAMPPAGSTIGSFLCDRGVQGVLLPDIRCAVRHNFRVLSEHDAMYELRWKAYSDAGIAEIADMLDRFLYLPADGGSFLSVLDGLEALFMTMCADDIREATEAFYKALESVPVMPFDVRPVREPSPAGLPAGYTAAAFGCGASPEGQALDAYDADGAEEPAPEGDGAGLEAAVAGGYGAWPGSEEGGACDEPAPEFESGDVPVDGAGPGSDPECGPAPGSDFENATDADNGPENGLTAEPEGESESESEQESESESESESEGEAGPEPEGESEPGSEPDSEGEPESESEPGSESESESEPDAEDESESESESEPEPDPEPESEPEAIRGARIGLGLEAEQPDLGPMPQTGVVPLEVSDLIGKDSSYASGYLSDQYEKKLEEAPSDGLLDATVAARANGTASPIDVLSETIHKVSESRDQGRGLRQNITDMAKAVRELVPGADLGTESPGSHV